jgi:hypothetical protein
MELFSSASFSIEDRHLHRTKKKNMNSQNKKFLFFTFISFSLCLSCLPAWSLARSLVHGAAISCTPAAAAVAQQQQLNFFRQSDIIFRARPLNAMSALNSSVMCGKHKDEA